MASSLSESVTGPAIGPVQKVFRIGSMSHLGVLDPCAADDTVSTMILHEVYETLYAPPTGPGAPEPLLLAERLRPEPAHEAAHPVYSAAVRPGIRFSDGTLLTPELLVRSLERSSDFMQKANVHASGDRIIFELRVPNPRFEIVLMQTWCSAVLERNGHLLGTGPFTLPPGASLAEIEKMNPLVLQRNPHFRQPSSFEALEFHEYPPDEHGGMGHLLRALEEGKIDFSSSLTQADAKALMGKPFKPSISKNNAIGYLTFNTEVPMVADPRVRRAIALSIDRAAVAKVTYGASSVAYFAKGFLPEMMGTGMEDHLRFAPAEAARLRNELGPALPRSIQLLCTWAPRPYYPNPRGAVKRIAESIAQHLGITVGVEFPRDRQDFFDRLRAGRFQMALTGWIADSLDDADYLEALYYSGSIPISGKLTATSNNNSRYRSAAFDASCLAYRLDPTSENRRAALDVLDADAPAVPIIVGQSVAILSTEFTGFTPSAIGRSPLASIRPARV